MSDVLPDPLGPRMTHRSSRSTRQVRSRSTSRSPFRRLTRSTHTAGSWGMAARVCQARSVAKVEQLWRFPVKSMQGTPFESGELGRHGFEGDRRWGVVDVESGKALSAKTVGKLLEASAVLAPDRESVEVTLPSGSVV